jgi:hypothetical protein
MLQVLLYNLICDVACAPSPVPYRPEVAAPIPLVQFRVLLLEQSRRALLHSFDQIRHGLRRRILDMHMDVVFAHYSFEDPHIFGVADLQKQVPAPHFDVAYKHRIAVLRYPYDMRLKASDCVPAMSVISHRARLLPCGRGV